MEIWVPLFCHYSRVHSNSELYLLVLVLAFTLIRLNRLHPEQVQHLEPSQPTFADPEPGYTKWWANRNSITKDQLLGDLIVLLGHTLSCWLMSSAAHWTFSPVKKRRWGEKYIADELSLWVSSCVPEPSESCMTCVRILSMSQKDVWKLLVLNKNTWYHRTINYLY